MFGAGVSFIFVDGFHHFLHMDHVHYIHTSCGTGVGVRGGWHGGAPMPTWGGMSHGGGMPASVPLAALSAAGERP